MNINRVNRAKQAEQDKKSTLNSANDATVSSAEESLTAIAERLAPLQAVPSDVLGVIVVGAGSCLDEMADVTRPGWLFDHSTDRETATLICADCPVRDQCLELELRLFGAAKHGMWGCLGEDGRRALHPVWVQVREDATDAGSRGDR